MKRYIDKDALVTEIEKKRDRIKKGIFSIPLTGRDRAFATIEYEILGKIKEFLDTLEVKDPYEQCIQYASIESGIKAHAEDYSFNIESLLFNQLTKEQQALWRKEIEQACISGGYSGLNLAKDPRYKENLQEESPTVYVITRCEEHSDYVEKVFLDYNKAVDYCGQFEGKEDEYGRDITKIEVTL